MNDSQSLFTVLRQTADAPVADAIQQLVAKGADHELNRINLIDFSAKSGLPEEKAFVGVRYNKAHGELTGIPGDVGANRWQVAGGWFILPGLLAKAEFVDQKYFGYPANNIKNGGHFKGFMMEGVVAF